MPMPILCQEEPVKNYDVIDAFRLIGYTLVSISEDVYTFSLGEDKMGDMTFLTVDMVQKEVYKKRHVYWNECKHLDILLSEEEENIIKKLFKKY